METFLDFHQAIIRRAKGASDPAFEAYLKEKSIKKIPTYEQILKKRNKRPADNKKMIHQKNYLPYQKRKAMP